MPEIERFPIDFTNHLCDNPDFKQLIVMGVIYRPNGAT